MMIWRGIIIGILINCFIWLICFKKWAYCCYCGGRLHRDFWWLTFGRCHFACYYNEHPIP